MNHLEKAKEGMKEYHSNFQVNDAIAGAAHALIAIAEQLERMNNQELRTEKLDFHSITRKVDK